MRKYLLLVLFISVGLGQDVLTTKKGIEYKGKMIEAGYDEVKFKPEYIALYEKTYSKEFEKRTLIYGTIS